MMRVCDVWCVVCGVRCAVCVHVWNSVDKNGMAIAKKSFPIVDLVPLAHFLLTFLWSTIFSLPSQSCYAICVQ